MKASEIQSIIKSNTAQIAYPDEEILHLLTDSRTITEATGTLFFAITTKRNSGCRYVEQLYQQGVRNFILPDTCDIHYSNANIWWVKDVVHTLQLIAAHHRAQFNIPVIGITGSNGKTIVKDWLVQLLSPDHRVVSSPKSYNSQIGVPLSVWQMSKEHDIAIFEAGISQPGEMEALQRIIQPTIGILTNIGSAHDENFTSREQKLQEKMKLFSTVDYLISSSEKNLQLLNLSVDKHTSDLSLDYHGTCFHVTIPLTDRASQENVICCISLMLYLGYSPRVIADRCATLTPVEMRLELNEATGNSLLINDSYSLDMASLTIALDYLAHQRRHFRRTLILSDIPQTGIPDRTLYTQVADLLRQRSVSRLIAIGPALSRCADLFADLDATFFLSTDDFLARIDRNSFHDETILLKGARSYGFERIANHLQRRTHETVMEVNLDALIHNLNYFRSQLRPSTKLMAMVKASSYGAGTVEVANALQFNHVDYLTVAYIDEGVHLRRNGITLPIMVMNPEPAGFEDIIRYNLEPDIYSFRILDLFTNALINQGAQNAPYPIHIEFDTGMHRLGFNGDDVTLLQHRLSNLKEHIQVVSVFSHLACSEDPNMDDFTHRQIDRLRKWSDGLPGLKHILNSSGISRFPEAQMDMVRLGIGLYGIAPEPEVQCHLHQVSRLVTQISQIKNIPAGDTVGYNCRWKASRPSRIAILTIGYADGLHRGLGNGNGRVSIGGQEAPIIGSICMDMCFVDVTDINCQEGDRAIIFGEGDLLQRNATAAGTIPYELLTAVAPRVKRLYFQE